MLFPVYHNFVLDHFQYILHHNLRKDIFNELFNEKKIIKYGIVN